MSVADEVRGYVARRPYIQEALVQGVVNLSALARQIQPDVSGGFEAVKAALRRLSDEIGEQRERRASAVGAVLDGMEIELRTGVAVWMLDALPDAEVLAAARTAHGWTVVAEEGVIDAGRCIDDQVVITLLGPDRLEATPGVLAFLLWLFDGRGINITELLSCREDTHIVIDAEDAMETFDLLEDVLSA
jgi:hypothetical protein